MPIDANDLLAQLDDKTPRGELRKHAKAIKRDHGLATALWTAGGKTPRLLAVLIMDLKQLDQPTIEGLAADLDGRPFDERTHVFDWLMANQLTKSKRTVRLMESWREHPAPLLRRLFWYHQARLRWTGQTPPDNTLELLAAIEADLEGEVPEVQWAMNFTAGQVGTYQPELRARCIALGERIGLYREEKAVRGCTPNYLPEFIRIQAAKVEGA